MMCLLLDSKITLIIQNLFAFIALVVFLTGARVTKLLGECILVVIAGYLKKRHCEEK